MGWFFGFKLHLIINNLGEIMGAKLTTANTDDRKPANAFANLVAGLIAYFFRPRKPSIRSSNKLTEDYMALTSN